MSSITLEKAISVFKREISDIDDREMLVDEITEGIEFVLLNGGGEILREWNIIARDGKFTFPRDLETPIKYKFSKSPNLGMGTFVSPFFNYSSNALQISDDYLDWDTRIEQKANRVFTQFDPPRCGVKVVLTSKDKRDWGKKVVVNGEFGGKAVAGIHNGFKTAGEVLTVYPECGEKKYSTFSFDKFTGVVKDKTCDWVMMSGISCVDNTTMYFLGHFHPDDEFPVYRQGEILTPFTTGTERCLHILGRINPSLRYMRDEEVIPITSVQILKLLAKRLRYEEAGDQKIVAVYEQRIKIAIKRQIAYQQKASRSLSFGLAGSAATASNV